MFPFAIKFIILFSVFFCCQFAPFMYFITEGFLNIGKRDSSSIGVSIPYMVQRVQNVVFQGGTKITYDFFFQTIPRTVSANKFCPAWKPNSATQYENARYTTINIFGIVSKLPNARHRHVKVMARTTKIIKEIKSQFVIHMIMFNSSLRQLFT